LAIVNGTTPSSTPPMYQSSQAWNLSSAISIGSLFSPVDQFLFAVEESIEGFSRAIQMYSLNIDADQASSPKKTKRQAGCDFSSADAPATALNSAIQGATGVFNSLNTLLGTAIKMELSEANMFCSQDSWASTYFSPDKQLASHHWRPG
jgi:hypothetical protein